MSLNNNKNSPSTLRCTVTFLARSALFLASLLPVGATAADKPDTDFDDEARWFQVELILFSHQTDLALDAEQWPDIKGLTLPEQLLELQLPQAPTMTEESLEPVEGASDAESTTFSTDPALEAAMDEGSDMPVAYQILPDDQLQLTDMAKKLGRSSGRELLLHIAWQQPTYDRKHAEPVYFEAGMAEPLPVPAENEAATDVSQPIPGEGTLLSTTELSAPEYATEEDRKIGPVDPQFTGTVTLIVERYIQCTECYIYRP